MQVYLPEDLYQQVKAQHLKPSELLQAAVREELKRRELEAEADRYIAELEAEIGEPSPEAVKRAEALVNRILEHTTRQAG